MRNRALSNHRTSLKGPSHAFVSISHWSQIRIWEDIQTVKQTTNPFEVFVIQNGVISRPHVSISAHLVALLQNQQLFTTHPLPARQGIHGQQGESSLSN